MVRLFTVILGISGAMAVGLGAFGAHGLEGRLSADLLETYGTAVRYQFYHTLALTGVIIALGRWPASRLPVWSGWLFLAGMAMFSGSLYLLVMTEVRWLGAVTPIGGAALIAGWLLLALAAWRGE